MITQPKWSALKEYTYMLYMSSTRWTQQVAFVYLFACMFACMYSYIHTTIRITEKEAMNLSWVGRQR